VTAGERPTVDLHPAAAWAVLVTASLGVLIAGAELMVVAIALPSIVADFGGWSDLARASWIVNAYLVAFVVAMPLAGRAADLWGARRLYLVALLLFAAGSLGSGLAPVAGPDGGIVWLIGWRTVQGLGGGAMVPLSLTIAAHIFGGRTRAVALGVEGAATFVGMAVGPAYGAWVLLNVSLPIPGLSIHPWQWIFLLNVPIAVVTLLAIYVVAGGIETPRHPGRLDLPGALVASVALVAGIGALSEAGSRGWGDPLVLAGLGVAGVGLVAFALLERRARAPLIDPHLFASAPFSAANAVSLLTGYTLATAIIGGPVFVNRVLNGGADESAVALSALTVAIAAGAIVGGLVSAVSGERPVTVLGVALTALALWWALDWGTGTDLGRLARDLAVFGAGFGLTVSPRATAAVAAAGSTAYGIASALLQITRTVGMSVGLALLTSIGQSRIDELTALIDDPARRDTLVRSLGHPEFVGVDPRASLLLTDLLERWSRTEAADVLRLVLAIALGVAVATLVPAILVGVRGARPAARAMQTPTSVFRRPDPPPR
jgi:EmrB/QacA subfamily drug resistance transporter